MAQLAFEMNYRSMLLGRCECKTQSLERQKREGVDCGPLERTWRRQWWDDVLRSIELRPWLPEDQRGW